MSRTRSRSERRSSAAGTPPGMSLGRRTRFRPRQATRSYPPGARWRPASGCGRRSGRRGRKRTGWPAARRVHHLSSFEARRPEWGKKYTCRGRDSTRSTRRRGRRRRSCARDARASAAPGWGLARRRPPPPERDRLQGSATWRRCRSGRHDAARWEKYPARLPAAAAARGESPTPVRARALESNQWA